MNVSWKDGLSWLIAIFFLLWALSLASTALLAGLLSLCIGLFFVPKIRREVVEHFDFELSRTVFLLIIIVGAFSIGALSPDSSTHQSPNSNQVTSSGEDYVEASKYNELQTENRDLQATNEQLRTQNRGLKSKLQNATFPPYVVARDRSFQATFKTQDGGTASYSINSSTVEAQINVGTYMREFSYSQLDYLGLESVYSQFEGESKYQRLGDYGSYYQLRPFVVEENFQTISRDIYQRYDTDQERVQEVWRYTTQMHSYSSEITETPRMPLETLVMGGGDCEDTAILAASMLKAMPEDWTVEFVFMDADNPANPQKIDHVLVYVETGEYQTFIETTSSTSMAPYDEISGYYVEV